MFFMKKFCCLLVLLFSFNILVSGQDSHSFQMRQKNAVYLELFGNSASFFSLNYDRIIKQYQMGYFNTSIGFAPLSYYGKGFSVPVSVNYSYGEKNGHLEVGLGVVLNKSKDVDATIDYMRLLANIRLGYKYQKPTSGLFFKAAFTPIMPIYYFHGSLQKNSLADLELIVFNSFSLCLGFSF